MVPIVQAPARATNRYSSAVGGSRLINRMQLIAMTNMVVTTGRDPNRSASAPPAGAPMMAPALSTSRNVSDDPNGNPAENMIPASQVLSP